MPATRSSESASYRIIPTCTNARTGMRNKMSSPINLLRPLTRSRALGCRFSPTSQRFYPYIPSILVSSSSLKFLRRARRASISTTSASTPIDSTDIDADSGSSLFGSSPTLYPPTSPSVLSDAMLSSPMSTTTTPGQYQPTQPTTPVTPTPGSHRRNGRGLQRTYAMRVSPVRGSPASTSASVPMDIESDKECTPRNIRVAAGDVELHSLSNIYS